MTVVGEVYAKVGAKDGGLGRDVEKIADEGGRRGGSRISAALNGVRPGFTGIRRESATAFGEVAKNAAEAFGLAFAAEKGYDFIKESVKDAGDYNTALLRLQNSMKNNPQLVHANAGAFQELASKISETTKTSTTSAIGGEAMLASFKLNQEQIERLLPLVNDYAVKAGVDLPTAARLFGRAATGNVGALSRLGVQIDKTKAKADPFGATLDALRQKAGGFAEEQGQTLQGRLDRLHNMFEELRVKVGEQVIPVLATLAGFAIKYLVPAMEKFGTVVGAVVRWVKEEWRLLVLGFTRPDLLTHLTGVEKIFNDIGRIARTVFVYAKEYWTDFVDALRGFKGDDETGIGKMIYQVGGAIRSLIPIVEHLYNEAKPYLADLAKLLAGVLAVKAVLAFGGAVASVIGKIQGMVKALLALFEINPVILILTAVGFALFELYKHCETFRNGVNALVAGIRRDFMPTVRMIWAFIQGNLIPIFLTLWRNISLAFTEIVASAKTNWPAIREIIVAVMTTIKIIVGLVLGSVLLLWRLFGSTIVRVVSLYFRTVLGVIQGVLNIVLGVITVVLNLITGHWGKAWQGVLQILRGVWQIITAVISGEIGTIGAILGRLFSLVTAPFRGAFNAALGIASSIGNAIVGVIAGWVGRIVAVVRGVQQVAGVIGGAFSSAYGAVSSAIGRIAGLAASLPGRIVGAIGDLGSLLYQAGANVVNGLVRGIESNIPSVGSVMHAVASKIAGFIPHSPAKEGPLSGAGDPTLGGRRIAQMLAAGLLSGQGDLSTALNGLLGNGGTYGPSIIDNAIAGAGSTSSAAARAAAAAAGTTASTSALAAAHLARQTALLERLLAATEGLPAGVGDQLQRPSATATLRSRGRVAGAAR